MKTIRKQYYGIKFPFTANNLDKFFLDLNSKIDDKLISEILHVILTPKGTRIRMPEFGTDLIKFIFDPNDEITIEKVKEEAVNAVGTYVKGANLDDIEVIMEQNDDNKIYLALSYSILKGDTVENNKTMIEL